MSGTAKVIYKISAPILLLGLMTVIAGCDEWMVGAPCLPETDNGSFNTDIANEQSDFYSVETRSVQCQTSLCITSTQIVMKPNEDENLSEYEQFQGTQQKNSFCSCRCADAAGHKADQNSDKYDDLCECPGSSVCEPIIGGNIEGAPEKVKGSYCIPKCIVEGCEDKLVGGEYVKRSCKPSTDSDEPWKWSCKI
jgi:hypothetical protein